MTYYKLKIPSFTQYKYAWAERPMKTNNSDDCSQCPKCGGFVGLLYWLPPYDIIIKQPKNVRDFVSGVIGGNFIVSERFKEKYEKSGLSGITNFKSVNIIQMGTTKKINYPIPKLLVVNIKITIAQVDYSRMNIKWLTKPKKNICALCGQGPDGAGGSYKSYDKIVLIKETLTNDNFFIPINLPGITMITEKAKNFIEDNKFTNVKLTPDFEARHNIIKIS